MHVHVHVHVHDIQPIKSPGQDLSNKQTKHVKADKQRLKNMKDILNRD